MKLPFYNILRQVVDVLVTEEQSVGWKKVQWSAKAVSLGVYFHRLEATLLRQVHQIAAERRIIEIEYLLPRKKCR